MVVMVAVAVAVAVAVVVLVLVLAQVPREQPGSISCTCFPISPPAPAELNLAGNRWVNRPNSAAVNCFILLAVEACYGIVAWSASELHNMATSLCYDNDKTTKYVTATTKVTITTSTTAFVTTAVSIATTTTAMATMFATTTRP